MLKTPALRWAIAGLFLYVALALGLSGYTATAGLLFIASLWCVPESEDLDPS